MASLFDIAKSGVQSYRQALAVTGQNIANINTEGYKRREANLEEVSASQGGITGIASQSGLGVRIESIRRSFDEFLLSRTYSTKAEFERVQVYLDQLKTLENTLLPSDADLGSQMGRFFASLQEVAAAPGDLPPRIIAIEEGRALADSFRNASSQLADIIRGTLSQADDAVTAVNILSTQLGEVNARILSAGQSGQAPNSILDLRDRLLGDIANLVEISVEYTDRGVANVTLGSSGVGPALVRNEVAVKLATVPGQDNLQVMMVTGSNQTPTNQIGKGVLAGLVNSYSFVTDIAKDVDHLAFTVSRELNAQHMQGLTMDGVSGREIFSANGLVPTVSAANRGETAIDLTISDATLLPAEDFTMTYREDKGAWQLTIGSVQLTSLGNNQFSGDGFSVKLTGAPKDGDTVSFSAARGAAAQMRFMLDRPQDLAAAGATNVMQDTANQSDAILQLESREADTYAVPPSVDQVFRNSDSPIVATQFLKDSVVATIPAGTQNISLSSYAEQARAQFELSLADIRQLPQLTIALETQTGETTYEFDLAFGTAFPLEAGDANWLSLDDLVAELNRGNLRAASGESLADLGIFASGAGGSLTLAAAQGSFGATTTFSTSNGTVSKRLTLPVDASTIHVFTREGRHLAGAPLTNAEITSLMSTKNGFSAFASYRADYLNDEGIGYRGMSMDISRTGGMQRLDIGANGVQPLALAGSGTLPASGTDSYAMQVALANGRQASVEVPAGASARYASQIYNAQLALLGVQAQARTRVILSGFADTGSVNFNLECVNQEPITIAADVTPGNLSGLVHAINAVESLTGVTATLNEAGNKVILESAAGEDIMISRVSSTSPAFSAAVIDDLGSVVSDQISFHDPDSNYDTARFSGTVKLSSAASFTTTLNDETVLSSADPFDGGLVAISASGDGSRKTLTFTAEEEIDIDQADDTGRRAVAAGGSYRLHLPQDGDAPAFVAEVSTAQVSPLTDENVAAALVAQLRGQAPIASLSGQSVTERPSEGETLLLRFADELYSLEMVSGEIVVSGGEPGRITAYFDKDNVLQVVSDGTLSASAINVPSNADIAGNGDAATRWGVDSVTNRFAGAEVVLAGSERSMTVTFAGTSYHVGVDVDGVIDDSQLQGTGLSVAWRAENVNTGRLVFTYDPEEGSVEFSRDLATEALGFKTTNVDLRLNGEQVTITSRDGTPVQVEASGASLAQQRLTLSDLPNEDLIIMVTGGGARSVSASYDIAPAVVMPPAYDIHITANGARMDIVDAETGHSIATRSIDAEGVAEFLDMRLRVSGQGVEGDVFHILPNAGGTGDGRNLEAMMRLQSSDINGANSGGFRQIFAQIVTSVGAAVRANDIALNAAEAGRDAALEAEMSFSGVNLDTEAAALLEFQQAYQASARVLSTARELFQTLMDVV